MACSKKYEIGQKINGWNILGTNGKNSSGSYLYIAECKCGLSYNKTSTYLNEHTKCMICRQYETIAVNPKDVKFRPSAKEMIMINKLYTFLSVKYDMCISEQMLMCALIRLGINFKEDITIK